MYFYKLILSITAIAGFRLLTLDQIYEKHKDTFIMNANSVPKISKVDINNIIQFYVVVHTRKLFFYTKGSYYGFIYDNDNVRLKLGPVNMNKVEYFTQNIEDGEDNEPVRKVKVLKWDDLIKRKQGDQKIENIEEHGGVSGQVKGVVEREHVDRLTFKHNMPAPHINIVNPKRFEDNRKYEEPNCPQENEYDPKGPSNYMKYQISSRPKDEKLYTPKSTRMNNTIEANNGPIEMNNKTIEEYKRHTNNQEEIESDSEMLDSKTLDIKVNTLDKSKKTFVLKNSSNLCVTYFEKSFILAECRKSKRQVFRLVNIDDVMGGIKPKNGPEDEIIEEPIHEDEEEIKSPEKTKRPIKQQSSNKEENQSEEQEIIKKPKKTKRLIKPQSSNKEDDQSEEQKHFIKKVENQYSPMPTANQSTEEPGIENYCNDLLNRNFGNLSNLPIKCQRMYGGTTNPITVKTNLPRNSISGVSMVKTSYIPMKERVPKQNVVAKKMPIYDFDKKNSILSRLEDALKS